MKAIFTLLVFSLFTVATAWATEPVEELTPFCETYENCDEEQEDLYVGPDGTIYDDSGEPIEDSGDDLGWGYDGL